jgi:TusA-related sulfurtransferase
MSNVFYVCLIILFMSTLFIIPGAVFADEITDSIEEAKEYYKEGDYVEAANSLDYASQLIRQKRSGKLEGLLPEPLAGWSAEDVKSQAAGPGCLGGMISAKRKYKKDKSSVTIEIITDSPALQSMVMLFSNPAYAAADGGKLTKIKRQKAIIKYHPSKKNGEINIVVAKQYLVSVKGRNVNQNDLVDYASAMDYKELKKF